MRKKGLMISNFICGIITIVALILTIIDIVGGATISDALASNSAIWSAVGVCVVAILIFTFSKNKDK